jgi:hypothetical protein
MGDTQFIFVGIQAYLTTYAEKDDFSQREVASLMLQKITSYWNIMDKCSITSAILDPRNKLSIFSDELTSDARTHILAIYEIYKEHSPNKESHIDQISSSTFSNMRQYFAKLRQKNTTITTSTTTTTLTMESELNHYLELPIDENTEPLLWWQAHAKEYPILSNMARDYLTIQATSVASEQVCKV